MCRYLLIWKQPRPQGFSLKKWVGPFFKGKALGTRLIWKRTVHRMAGSNCGFSHDVTKIQTTKLSILLRFYFHGALEQLRTNSQTNFRFKRVLGFVKEYA